MLKWPQIRNSPNRRTSKPPYRTIICIYHLFYSIFHSKGYISILGLLLSFLLDTDADGMELFPYFLMLLLLFYILIYTYYLDTSTSNRDPLRPRSLFKEIYCGCSTTKPNKKVITFFPIATGFNGVQKKEDECYQNAYKLSISGQPVSHFSSSIPTVHPYLPIVCCMIISFCALSCPLCSANCTRIYF